MMRTRMEREWRANQYEDAPLVTAIELLRILFGPFSRGWPARLAGLLLVGLRGRFDADLRIVGQAIGPRCDYAIAFRQTVQNLYLIALPDSGLDCFLVSLVVGACDHHVAASVGSGEDGCCRNDG